MEGEIRVEYMRLPDIQKAERNPKDHDLGQIFRSVKRFGYVMPMLLDERTGRLVAGQGRLETILQMKASSPVKPPERIKVDADGEWLAPVLRGISFNSDSEAQAYLIADNRLTELGGWIESDLIQVLQDLAKDGAEALEGIGYDLDDLDAMLALNPQIEPGIESAAESDIPETSYRIVLLCETQDQFLEWKQKLGLPPDEKEFTYKVSDLKITGME